MSVFIDDKYCGKTSPDYWTCTLKPGHNGPHEAYTTLHPTPTDKSYATWYDDPPMYPWQGAHHDPSKIVNKIEFIKFFRQTTGCSLLAAKLFCNKVYDDFVELYDRENKPQQWTDAKEVLDSIWPKGTRTVKKSAPLNVVEVKPPVEITTMDEALNTYYKEEM